MKRSSAIPTLSVAALYRALFGFEYVQNRIAAREAHVVLADRKREQRRAFNLLRVSFADLYARVSHSDLGSFMTSLWADALPRLERCLFPVPRFSFTKDPTIRKAMVVSPLHNWLRGELKFLESQMTPKRLMALSEEDYVGQPMLMSGPYLTSPTTVHHLHHVFQFAVSTGVDVGSIEVIVEWGGGYGNMAKLFRRLQSSASTYTIIDLPLFSCLQWLYLATICGEDQVNLVVDRAQPLLPGKINLLPVCFLDQHDLRADLFVSTWGLNESSLYAQDLVVAKEWFHSRHLPLALPRQGHLGRLTADAGASIVDIQFPPGSSYGFR